MRPFLTTLSLLCALMTVAVAPAAAGPVNTAFNGSVTGYWSLPIVQDDFPLGTQVQYSFSFDDAFREVGANLFPGLTQAITGTLRVGNVDIALHTLRLSSYGFNAANPNGISHFGFQVLGDAPDTDDGEPFSGLWIYMSSDARSAAGISMVSYGNTNGAVVDNGFLMLSGSTTFEQGNAVPEPATFWLTATMLGALACTRRRVTQRQPVRP